MSVRITVSTHSKRKNRKRKYHEMRQSPKIERKQTPEKKMSVETENDLEFAFSDNETPDVTNTNVKPDLAVNQSTLSQLSQCSVSSSVSMPSPSKRASKHNFDDIDCDGVFLKSQKANLDEFRYLIKGIEIIESENNANDSQNTLNALIKLALWLKNDDNHIVIGGSKFVPLLLDKLRILSRVVYSQSNERNSIAFAIVVVIHTLCEYQLNDVSINILLRYLRIKASTKDIMQQINQSNTLSDNTSANQTPQRRRSRRSRGKNPNKNKCNKIADEFIKLIDDENGTDNDDAGDTNGDGGTYANGVSDKIKVDFCDSNLGFICSVLLLKIVENSLEYYHCNNNKDNNKSSDDRKFKFCSQIMDYISHPMVIYKLSCITQMDSVNLQLKCEEKQENMAIECMSNQLKLLDIISRYQSTKSETTDKTANKSKEDSRNQGLLKILDSIGLILRYTHCAMKKEPSQMPMDCDGDDEDLLDLDISDEKKLLLIKSLKVLTNISNERKIKLKTETVVCLFDIYTNYYGQISDSNIDYQIVCLVLGVFINCCQKNKKFREGVFDVKRIEILIVNLIELNRKILEIEKERNENEDNDDKKTELLYESYISYKVISFYNCLLLGFLLQSQDHFKLISFAMNNDLSVILIGLKNCLEFQKRNIDQKSCSVSHTNITRYIQTQAVITRIIQIVQIRQHTLLRKK